MDMHLTDGPEEQMAETPEDVAILYSWANLHGAKYRDFSASRREYRAQVRHRAAEELRQAELSAQADAESAAADAERVARDAERAARASERFDSPNERERALREADEAVRRAAAERVEAARRAEAAAVAEAAARREEREIAEAHASAQRQAARWNDSEVRRHNMAGPQPARVPSLSGDPYEVAQGSSVDGEFGTPNRQLEYTQPQRYRDDAPRYDERRPEEHPSELRRAEQLRMARAAEPEMRRPRGFRPDQASGVRTAYRAPGAESSARRAAPSDFTRITPPPVYSSTPARPAYSPDLPIQSASAREDRGFQPEAAPAWLYSAGPSAQPITPLRSAPHSGFASGPAAGTDTLQQSREKVASRWFALKGVFEGGPESSTFGASAQKDQTTPVLAVFSLAGGVGKTSLVATLGRALSSLGEKVLLADTTSHGLLPYYFGATELKPGVVRTFSPPTGSADAPIHLVSYDVDSRNGDSIAQDDLAHEIMNGANGAQRLLVDFNVASGWLMRRLTHTVVTVLVPVAPDMNSVISLQTVERYFQGATNHEGRPLQPFYLLNQFDASLPLHLDVREVLRRQLGDRLLPCVIRRSPAVSEALAEGMTVVDYQSEGAVAEDYLNVANWLISVSAPAASGLRTTRWSER